MLLLRLVALQQLLELQGLLLLQSLLRRRHGRLDVHDKTAIACRRLEIRRYERTSTSRTG